MIGLWGDKVQLFTDYDYPEELSEQPEGEVYAMGSCSSRKPSQKARIVIWFSFKKRIKRYNKNKNPISFPVVMGQEFRVPSTEFAREEKVQMMPPSSRFTSSSSQLLPFSPWRCSFLKSWTDFSPQLQPRTLPIKKPYLLSFGERDCWVDPLHYHSYSCGDEQLLSAYRCNCDRSGYLLLHHYRERSVENHYHR